MLSVANCWLEPVFLKNTQSPGLSGCAAWLFQQACFPLSLSFLSCLALSVTSRARAAGCLACTWPQRGGLTEFKSAWLTGFRTEQSTFLACGCLSVTDLAVWLSRHWPACLGRDPHRVRCPGWLAASAEMGPVPICLAFHSLIARFPPAFEAGNDAKVCFLAV